jgi:enoyl-CoA hydratase/carnithine racemase
MNGFETVIYEKQEGIGYITLDRPEALNTYNIKMRDELFQVLGAVRDDPDVRVVVLRGAGEKAFCAGADLSEFLTAPSPAVARRVRWERDVWGLFLGIDKPIIAALHGYVLGDGIEMALCCDIRIASEDARLGVPETGLGIIPAAGGSQTLPRVVGMAHGLEMLLVGRWVGAEEARRMRLVNRVVPREDLWPTVDGLAERIVGFNVSVLSCAKQAITRGLDLGLEEGLRLEARLGACLLQETSKEAT